jgi:hypothetical protein
MELSCGHQYDWFPVLASGQEARISHRKERQAFRWRRTDRWVGYRCGADEKASVIGAMIHGV